MTLNNKRLFFICISTLLIFNACDLINSGEEDKKLEKLSVSGDIAGRTDWFHKT
jgi:hypothetical protein